MEAVIFLLFFGDKLLSLASNNNQTHDQRYIMTALDKPGAGPLVSVVMSVYNTERYVGDAVMSVLGQSYRNLEMICFNDASTDSSLSILQSIAERDGRMRVINSPVNIRQGGGRNRAIKASKGDYIMFLDSDDELKPYAVERCVAAALANDSEAVFFDYCRFMTGSDKETEICQLGKDAVSLRGDDLRRRILERTASHVTAMYARSVIVDNDLFFPEGIHYEDNAVGLAMQTIARNPVKLNEVFYRYRFDNESVTRSVNNPRFFDRIESAEILLEHTKRLGLYDRFKDLVDYQFTNLYFVHTVFGAIYRFDRVQADQIRRVKRGIKTYLPSYRRNPYYRSQPFLLKLKIESHVRWPHLIKFLSNVNRKLRK